ncbi:uncharacterized protein BJX67DRAFT_290926 [Aspergillus lucknowensis]|uniref:Uncharacterized protein n=1 Tax=Aspergillus lucknowensis TaxID=176173 RepID=A0ABR4LE55_9EURO
MSSNPNDQSRGDNIPGYVDPSSVPIGRELGILFGFVAASLVITAVYSLIWRAVERRDEERDRLRKERLVARGVHHGRGGLHEKMLDQEVLRVRAELPVHADGGATELGGEEGINVVGGARVREREREMWQSRIRP